MQFKILEFQDSISKSQCGTLLWKGDSLIFFLSEIKNDFGQFVLFYWNMKNKTKNSQ